MKTYVKINPIERVGGEPLDELKIRVEYVKDMLNGKRGVYAFFTPVHRGEYFETCTLCADIRESGFRMFLRELNRKSQKIEDELSEKVIEKADEIAGLWNEKSLKKSAKLLELQYHDNR